MKILIVTPHYYPEQFKITEIAEYIAINNDVTVWTNIPDYPNRKPYKSNWKVFKNRKEIINNVKIKRIFSTYRGKGLIALFFNYLTFYINSTLKAIFNKEKFDIVLNWETSPIFSINAGNVVAKKQNIPVVTYVLDLWPQSLLVVKNIKKTGFIYKIVEKQSKNIYKNSTSFIVTSKKFTDQLKRFGIKEEQITYIPNFCETIFEKNITNPSFKINDVPNDRFKILFAGNIGKAQDFNILINIAKKAKEANDLSFLFLVVGDGSEKANLIASIKSNGLENYFVLKEKTNISNMPNYYDVANAFIYTLIDNEIIQYTLPGKVSSYLAYNKPIITSCLGESFDVLSNFKGSVFINSDNGYFQIKNLIKNYSLILKDCDRNYFESTFKKDIVLNNIEGVLINERKQGRK